MFSRPPASRSAQRFTRAPLRLLARLAAALGLAASAAAATAAPPKCLTDCTPRIGIVSAFGAEADILLAEATGKRTHTVNGNRFTTGTLRGNRVVIVLSGVSMINSTMVTQLLLDHFRVERLLMSGIAGGINPARHVGDVTVPERWVMPMEVYWNADDTLPAPCGKPGEMACLGLEVARDAAGAPLPAFNGLFMRKNWLLHAGNAPKGEYRFDYPVDADMLAVARTLRPTLARCGTPDDKGAPRCVGQQPQLIVGGTGVSGTAFLADPKYRDYLFRTLVAETVEMETAALAHVAYANRVPYIAFRSLSDLAGAHGFDADVMALFTSGLAERNEAAVTLAFLEAWRARKAAKGGTR